MLGLFDAEKGRGFGDLSWGVLEESICNKSYQNSTEGNAKRLSQNIKDTFESALYPRLSMISTARLKIEQHGFRNDRSVHCSINIFLGHTFLSCMTLGLYTITLGRVFGQTRKDYPSKLIINLKNQFFFQEVSFQEENYNFIQSQEADLSSYT